MISPQIYTWRIPFSFVLLNIHFIAFIFFRYFQFPFHLIILKVQYFSCSEFKRIDISVYAFITMRKYISILVHAIMPVSNIRPIPHVEIVGLRLSDLADSNPHSFWVPMNFYGPAKCICSCVSHYRIETAYDWRVWVVNAGEALSLN